MVLLSLVQAPSQQSAESTGDILHEKNTFWDYHPAFSLMQFLFGKKCCAGGVFSC